MAVNSDPEASIFKSADLGFVGDWEQVVPALARAIQSARVSAAP